MEERVYVCHICGYENKSYNEGFCESCPIDFQHALIYLRRQYRQTTKFTQFDEMYSLVVHMDDEIERRKFYRWMYQTGKLAS